jgi:hypothetical protein
MKDILKDITAFTVLTITAILLIPVFLTVAKFLLTLCLGPSL